LDGGEPRGRAALSTAAAPRGRRNALIAA
jgi:hypothetical protein